MKQRKIVYTAVIILAIVIISGAYFFNHNKIVATVRGAEMDEIIMGETTYIKWSGSDMCPYSRTDKDKFLGSGAYSDGTKVLEIYTVKGDKDINYLYARFGYEGQMYVRESLIK